MYFVIVEMGTGYRILHMKTAPLNSLETSPEQMGTEKPSAVFENKKQVSSPLGCSSGVLGHWGGGLLTLCPHPQNQNKLCKRSPRMQICKIYTDSTINLVSQEIL